MPRGIRNGSPAEGSVPLSAFTGDRRDAQDSPGVRFLEKGRHGCQIREVRAASRPFLGIFRENRVRFPQRATSWEKLLPSAAPANPRVNLAERRRTDLQNAILLFLLFHLHFARKDHQYRNPSMHIVKSLLYFLLAGLCEIGGGYLMWLWLREGRSLLFGLSGAAILIVYGIVPTLQPLGAFTPRTEEFSLRSPFSGAGSSTMCSLTASTSLAASSRSPAWPLSCTRRADGFAAGTFHPYGTAPQPEAFILCRAE